MTIIIIIIFGETEGTDQKLCILHSALVVQIRIVYYTQKLSEN